jgi:hypothetical protein
MSCKTTAYTYNLSWQHSNRVPGASAAKMTGQCHLLPSVLPEQGREGAVRCRERLVGLLKYYHHKAV